MQKLNATSMFGVSEEYLLVGNGEAELINVLGKVLTEAGLILTGQMNCGISYGCSVIQPSTMD